MGEIFGFLLKPTKTTESLILKGNNYKFLVIGVLLALYSLTSVGNLYFSIMGGLYDTGYFIKLFFYKMISSVVFVGVVWGIGKAFGGKSVYINVLLITLIAEITFIIANILNIGILLINPGLLLGSSILIYLPAVVWFLIIWSKGLAKTEDFSETKVTITVILSIIILYFGNLFLYGITGLSLL